VYRKKSYPRNHCYKQKKENKKMNYQELKTTLSTLGKARSLDKLVEAIKQLRTERERFDAAMMIAIYRIEKKHMKLLRDNGCDSIERFIESWELCGTARYRSFVSGLIVLKEQEAFRMGAESTIDAGKIQSTTNLAEYVASTHAWMDEHGGVAPTSRTAAKIRLQVEPQKVVPGALRRQGENTILRKRIHELEVENRQLKHQLAKLQKKAPVKKNPRNRAA